MAGPAIRAGQMARALATEHAVDLVTTPERSRRERPPGAPVDGARARALAARCRRRRVPGPPLVGPRAARRRRGVVVDLYDPFHLESFEQTRHLAPRRAADVGTSIDVVNEQLRRGDFFLCASERQRDFWLGHLAAPGG